VYTLFKNSLFRNVEHQLINQIQTTLFPATGMCTYCHSALKKGKGNKGREDYSGSFVDVDHIV
jgi:hypothetical protein